MYLLKPHLLAAAFTQANAVNSTAVVYILCFLFILSVEYLFPSEVFCNRRILISYNRCADAVDNYGKSQLLIIASTEHFSFLHTENKELC